MAKRSGVRRLHSLCVLLTVLSIPGPGSAFFVAPGSTSTSSPTTPTTTTSLGLTAMRRRPKKRPTKQPPDDTPRRQQRQQQSASSSSSPSSSSSSFSNNILLDDGSGHINADLAAVLWNWEQEHRETAKLPKLSFSTRQGLRLVNDIVKSISESPRGQKFLKGKDDSIRTDLVQEGVMALMDALNDYRQQQANNDNNSDEKEDVDDEDNNITSSNDKKLLRLADQNKRFEAYARPYLEQRLWSTLDKTTRPVQLPETESLVWKQVEQMLPLLRDELGGRDPTTQELAARLELPVATLELLLAAKRGTLSMESTVEIINPDSLEDQTSHFADQEEWEEREGHLLDTGTKIIKDELVDEYQDEMYQYEGEDEMWIHQTQIAGPLKEIIPDEDGDPSPDDFALSDMIRHDVGAFLTKTLTPEEEQIVRMSFGLDFPGEPMQWGAIGQAMNMDVPTVKQVLTEALGKLRTSYQTNYVETYLGDEQDFFGEDSV